MQGRIGKSALFTVFALIGTLVIAEAASAVLSGRDGRIAFTSGRAAGDATAQIYTINPVNLGPVEGPFGIPGVQNRHASWSPDRTKLVFAAGTPGSLATEEYDIFVRDFEAEPDTVTALDQTQLGDELSSDHPAWSPDGTRIAYETQPADPGNDSTDRNIMVKTFGTSAAAVPLANSANFELKPAWSPDSSEIYYATSPTPPPGATQFDIVKKNANANPATAPTGVATSATVDEYQPSISPNGSQICYTRQSTLGNTGTADIYVADLPGLTNQRDISDDLTKGDINCSWSPEGFEIAFSNGTFSAARLMVEDANDNDIVPALQELTNDTGGNDFDGNADWGPDGSPDCPDITATTRHDTAVTIELECTDTGPDYELTDPNGFANTEPQNGTTGDDSILTNPSTVKYTPNPGFAGTDTFTYTSFDDFGFGTDDGTVTVTVQGPDLNLESKKQKLRKRVKFFATASADATLVIAGKKINEQAQELVAGQRTKVTAKLKRKARKRLKKKLERKRKAAVALSGTATIASGLTVTDELKVKLKRKR
jgi:Tol biopolymer transport system component